MNNRLEYVNKCVEARKELGLRKIDIARGFGIDKSVITKFENGNYNSFDLYIYYMDLLKGVVL